MCDKTFVIREMKTEIEVGLNRFIKFLVSVAILLTKPPVPVIRFNSCKKVSARFKDLISFLYTNYTRLCKSF